MFTFDDWNMTKQDMYQLSAVCIQGVLGLLHFGEPIADDQPDTGDVSWPSRWLCQPMTPTRPK